jgi:hypothetical protein
MKKDSELSDCNKQLICLILDNMNIMNNVSVWIFSLY